MMKTGKEHLVGKLVKFKVIRVLYREEFVRFWGMDGNMKFYRPEIDLPLTYLGERTYGELNQPVQGHSTVGKIQSFLHPDHGILQRYLDLDEDDMFVELLEGEA